MLIAMLGKLGRADEAGPYIERITAQKPEFPGRARELFRRSLKIDPLIEDFIAGLRAAGLSISD